MWKSTVSAASAQHESITKGNFLKYYSDARKTAFKESTVQSAWRKTGLHPLDPSALDPVVFAPALNTTTQAAPLIPTSTPPLFSLAPPSSTTSTPAESSSDYGPNLDASDIDFPSTSAIPLHLNIPPRLPLTASKTELYTYIDSLINILKQAEAQIQRDHVDKMLKDIENEHLRQQLFVKKKSGKDTRSSSNVRHMTSDVMVDRMARDAWSVAMRPVFAELLADFRAKEAQERAEEKERAGVAQRLKKDAKAAVTTGG